MKLFEIGLFLILHNSVNIYIGHCTTKLFSFIYEKWGFLVASFFSFSFLVQLSHYLLTHGKTFLLLQLKRLSKPFYKFI